MKARLAASLNVSVTDQNQRPKTTITQFEYYFKKHLPKTDYKFNLPKTDYKIIIIITLKIAHVFFK